MADKNVDQISIRFVKPGSGTPAFTVDNWTSYTFDSDFFNPSDSFSFELSDDRAEQLKDKIILADPVELLVNGTVECKGFVEALDFSYSVNGGTTLRLSGRDILGVVCDGTMAPNVKITDSSSFEDALLKAFENAGWDKDHIAFVNFNNSANFKPETYQNGSGRKKSDKIGHQLKPHKNEGFMEFALRICRRSGWNIKLTPDGSYIHIGMPNYFADTYDPVFIHKLKNTTSNNILTGSVSIDWRKQPSYIIGEATGAGGNFRKGLNSVFAPNTLLLDQNDMILVGYSHLSEKKVKWLFPGDERLISNLPKMVTDLFPGMIAANSPEGNSKLRPLFEYDDESKTLASLEYVMRKKMADFQSNMFSLVYTVSGHSQKIDGAAANYAINVMCKVIDETYGFDNAFWVQKRTFTKSRTAGTKTQLTLKLPYIYVFPTI
jgi:hypothetical protein